MRCLCNSCLQVPLNRSHLLPDSSSEAPHLAGLLFGKHSTILVGTVALCCAFYNSAFYEYDILLLCCFACNPAEGLQMQTAHGYTCSSVIKVTILTQQFFTAARRSVGSGGVNLPGWACVAYQPEAEPGGCSEPRGEPHTADGEERLPGYSVGHQGQPVCSLRSEEHLQPG